MGISTKKGDEILPGNIGGGWARKESNPIVRQRRDGEKPNFAKVSTDGGICRELSAHWQMAKETPHSIIQFTPNSAQ